MIDIWNNNEAIILATADAVSQYYNFLSTLFNANLTLNDRFVAGGIATFACEQNTIEYNGACVCNFLNGYAGVASQCAQCSETQIISMESITCTDCDVGAIRNNENTCVCNTAGYFVENTDTGKCVCDSELRLVLSASGDTCVCDS